MITMSLKWMSFNIKFCLGLSAVFAVLFCGHALSASILINDGAVRSASDDRIEGLSASVSGTTVSSSPRTGFVELTEDQISVEPIPDSNPAMVIITVTDTDPSPGAASNLCLSEYERITPLQAGSGLHAGVIDNATYELP